jgi:hypothetical protein
MKKKYLISSNSGCFCFLNPEMFGQRIPSIIYFSFRFLSYYRNSGPGIRGNFLFSIFFEGIKSGFSQALEIGHVFQES